MHFQLSRILITGALAAFLPVAVLAQTLPLTLGQAIALAQERAPGLRGADAAARAADAGVEVAGLRPNPT